MSLMEALKKAIYSQDFLKELGLLQKQKVTIFCDNIGAIKLGKNLVFDVRTKHIDIKHYLVQKVQANGIIQVNDCQRQRMVTDVLTKGLKRETQLVCQRA